MKRFVSCIASLIVFFPLLMHAQLDKIVIPAGTPEDKALQAITNEPDQAKKLSMYQDFLQTFASNPAAVAYGNWQISQYYQTDGDMQKALDYGDKALQGSPITSTYSYLRLTSPSVPRTAPRSSSTPYEEEPPTTGSASKRSPMA